MQAERVDVAVTWDEVNDWRQRVRATLLSDRRSMTARERARACTAVAEALTDLLSVDQGGVLGFYWPCRFELDLRALMQTLYAAGARLALPAVVIRGRPVEYRPWKPGQPLVSDLAGVPAPADGPPVQPDVLVAPLLGFDDENFRLGLGAGYFDRTLASLGRMPWTIGVGFEAGRLVTIHPQPHDIPLDLIVTESRVQVRTRSRVSAAHRVF